MEKLHIGIIGASGYTGAELVRLLAQHPNAHVAALSGERQAGKKISEVFPPLHFLQLPKLVRMEDVALDKLDAVFCCLPHATSQAVIKDMPGGLRIIDLSADYRIRNVKLYGEVYGHEHVAPDLQKEAVYGLSEHYRTSIAKARLIANPGCYPTAAQLALIPLLKAGLIDPSHIIIDAASGVSGAGREPKLGNIFAEVSENFTAYGITHHRHAPEIEQELSLAAGKDIIVSFTPHLLPMTRGILETIYVKLQAGTGLEDLRSALGKAYRDEPFVHLVNHAPSTKEVRGTNNCLISLHEDRRPGYAILVSVIDNLVKGASGQAIQNLNIMMGWEEGLGLTGLPLFP